LRAISNGRIHREQLDFCVDAVAGSPQEDLKVVVAHHHFCPAPDYEKDEVMPQSKRAMNVFQSVGIDMILGGHLHRAYIGNSLDFYPGISRERGIIIVQSGTTTSRRGRGREREKNSFNVIAVEQQMLKITHYMYFDQRQAFAPISRHLFPRPGKAFVEDDLPAEEPAPVERL
jgi:3',5'-cyclic AMP phosphodiesterase CpdA